MADAEQVQVNDLPITPVDPDSPIPLYYQIEADLRRLIDSGNLSVGAALPPELELCRVYEVSRHTMRMALSRLAADNLIVRYAGRGTFVEPRTDRMKFYLDRSFTQQMADIGREAHSKVLEISTGTIGEASPEPLQKNIGASCMHLARLRFGDNEPIGLQYSTIITEACPGLEKYDFNRNSLYDILASEYRLIITQIHQTFGAVAADEFQAESLQISVGDPLLLVNTTVFLENHQVIEYTSSYYRTDKYEYSTTHTYPG